MSLRFKLPEGLSGIKSSPPALPRITLQRRAPRPRPINCLNCGAALTGNFCANCGQEAVDHRMALWPLLQDVLNEFARWDSKFFRTLIPLLIRPGFVTNQYNAGKRASYLSPFRLFLTVSVIFFLILSAQTRNLDNGAWVPQKTVSDKQAQAHVASARKQSAAALAQAQQAMRQAGLGKTDLHHYDVGGKAASTDGAGVQIYSDSQIDEGLAILHSRPETTQQELDAARSPTNWRSVPLLFPHARPDDALFSAGSDQVMLTHLPITFELYDALQHNPAYPYKNGPFVRRLVQQAYLYAGNRELFIQNLFNNVLPKTAICILPLFALILYPLYLRTRRYYVEHLVFALHNHTFLLIVLSVMFFTPAKLNPWIMLGTAVYFYAAMLNVYRQSWWVTLFKFSFTGVVYTILLSLTAAAATLVALLL